MDLTRFAAVLSVPAAYALGRLTFAQLLVVAVVVARGRHRVQGGRRRLPEGARPAGDLLVANARFESTTWTATALGPPLGGAAIGLLGPVTTVLANAVSFLLSAPASARSAAPSRGRGGPASPATRRRSARRLAAHPHQPGAAPAVRQHDAGQRPDPGDSAAGRRAHARRARLRALAVRPGVRRALRRRPGRLPAGPAARRPVARTRSCASPARCARAGRSASPSSAPARRPVLVIAVQLGLVTSMGVFNPVFATYRLDHTAPDWSPARWPRGRSAATPASPR